MNERAKVQLIFSLIKKNILFNDNKKIIVYDKFFFEEKKKLIHIFFVFLMYI